MFDWIGCWLHSFQKSGYRSWQHGDPRLLDDLRTRISDLPRGSKNWRALQTLARIISERRLGEQVEIKTSSFSCSRKMDVKTFLKAKRSHSAIENGLHWVLDVAYQEDHSRVRKDHAPENQAVLRHMAVNRLKQEKTLKVDIHAKRLQAGWDNDYLLKVLSG